MWRRAALLVFYRLIADPQGCESRAEKCRPFTENQMRKNERTASAQMYSDAESAGRSEHGAVTDNPAREEHSADTDTAHRTRAAEILPPRGSMPESDGDCLDYVATCLFGLERLVGEEIDALGYERTFTMDGRVGFRAGADAAARCNMWLRTAERLYASLGSFTAPTFDALFEGTKALPWERFIGREDAFPVKGHAVRSQLYSIPDCQSIVKKALADRLGGVYGLRMLPETGIKYQVEFFIFKDEATMMIDLSGTALHKRGYRAEAGDAPLRETLAAALALISRPREEVLLWDPFCGSATIPIEAAMIMTRRAPGCSRSFCSEEFPMFPPQLWRDAREEAADAERRDSAFETFGSDIDPDILGVAAENARLAGVSDRVKLFRLDAREVTTGGRRGTIVCNPPYGERMGTPEQIHRLYRDIGRSWSELGRWQKYILTSDEEFERYFGARADKVRRLYNGMLRCGLYQYFKPADKKGERKKKRT